MIDGRVCTRCKAWKPREEFHIGRHLRDGMNTRCKVCVSVLQLEKSRRLGDFCLLMKVCRVCNVERPRQAFPVAKGRKDGRENRCRECKASQWAQSLLRLKEEDFATYEARILVPAREAARSRVALVVAAGGRPGDVSKHWRSENRDRLLKEKRKWREAQAFASGKPLGVRSARSDEERRLDHETRMKAVAMRRLIRARARRALPRMTDAERARLRMKTDRGYAINQRMRVATGKAMKGAKAGRRWESLVGYTVNDLLMHLERQLPRGYSMADFGNGRLHIDHIIPKSTFDVTNPEELRACWALSNLRPLPAKANMRKGARRVSLL